MNKDVAHELLRYCGKKRAQAYQRWIKHEDDEEARLAYAAWSTAAQEVFNSIGEQSHGTKQDQGIARTQEHSTEAGMGIPGRSATNKAVST